ncbi:hypothetical protein L210DRAFT_3474243 [Boletus edulis BED1]|uniref:Uncharacterized protein n=1 Tax=Boletus edulis BED1 TaxID=1328754 RepID=A0AAD4C1G6_BOLED|nr:hypothetical protein L210DRAFT_3474243 [Boletus edulis BED1]
MAWWGIDDLRGYMKDAVLPELKYGREALGTLPPSGHKSHRNTLSTRFRKERHLTSIQSLEDAFDNLVNNWIMANVPDASLGLSLRDQDERTGEVLTVPSARKFRISSTLPAPVTEFNRLWAWIDHFPLRTVQRILHILYPQTKDWGFMSETQPHYDDHIFKEFYFTRTECPSTAEIASNSVLVACQPPWVLSTEDMWQFTELQSLPAGNTRLRGKERLWCKLWDLCVRKQCFYFIITSYQQWTFGVFSDGWTNAYISPPFDARSRQPTVMHAILYWLASALDIDDGYSPPSLPEPIEYVMGQFGIPPSDTCGPDTIQESLSSWAGQSDDVSPSARVNVCAPMGMSEAGDDENLSSEPYIKPRDPAETRLMVERWRATLPITLVDRRKGRRTHVQMPCSPHPRPDPDLMSPLSIDLFKDTASTTASSDCTEVGNNKGHWLVSINRR